MQASTYTLDRNKLADALAILAGEAEALAPLVRIQRKMIPRITKANYTIFGIMAVFGVLLSHSWVSFETVLVPLGLIMLVFSIVILPSGLGELRAWSRLRKAEGRLGLARTKYVSSVGRKELRARLPLLILALIGSFMWIGLVLLNVFFDYVSPWINDFLILGCAFATAVSSSSGMVQNTLILLRRLEVAEHLRDRLLKQQAQLMEDENQTFSISEEEYKQIARIEQALISKDRERAIKQSAKNSEQFFRAVQQSSEVLRKKSTLEPSIRLRVQTQIDELSTQPHPPAAHEVDGTWRLPVPECSLEIKYVLDPKLQHIMVHDIADAQSASVEKV